MKDVLDAQRQRWQERFIQKPEMFGSEPSHPAQAAAELFEKEGKIRILELGGGQGRDTLFFAGAGFHVHVLDYSAAETIPRHAQEKVTFGARSSIRQFLA